MAARQEWYCKLAGIISGLLLMAPNLWSPLAPLQTLALVPIFYLGAASKIRCRIMLAAGLYMGLA